MGHQTRHESLIAATPPSVHRWAAMAANGVSQAPGGTLRRRGAPGQAILYFDRLCQTQPDDLPPPSDRDRKASSASTKLRSAGKITERHACMARAVKNRPPPLGWPPGAADHPSEQGPRGVPHVRLADTPAAARCP